VVVGVKNFFLIGLIGGLASGKSTVRQMLEQLGAYGIDADLLAHVVMRRGTPVWRAIVDAFGVQILTHDGHIDRRQLGKRVFGDPAALQMLESIVHPAVLALIKDLLRANTKPVVVLEAIKLFETGMDQWCDALWAVSCTAEKQIERVMRTRQLSAAEARARLAAQGSFNDKLRRADVVIDNSGDPATTRVLVTRLWQAIRPETARDKSAWLGDTAHGITAPVTPRVGVPVPPSPPTEKVVTPTPAATAPVTPPTEVATPAPVVAAPVTPPIQQVATPAPAATAPVTPPTEVATPAPAATALVTPPTEVATPAPAVATPATPLQIEVRRSRRSDLDALAVAIAKRENLARPLSREEALRRFGTGGYRIALEGKHIIAFAAWEVENLVAMTRELWAESNYVASLALPRLLDLIEEEARGLLCEVSVIFLEVSAPSYLSEQVGDWGYRPTVVANLHPLWQPIVHERLKPGERIWAKLLRTDLITQPF
jgi:dephospho-CoA kinase